jgi:hypothetical protein
MPPPRNFPRVPDRLPWPDTTGPDPSPEALETLRLKTRAVRVYPGELGEHGPFAKEPMVELRGSQVDEFFALLAFEPPPARFRIPNLGHAAIELRGRLFRVGLLGLIATGELRVMGWGSDVRLRDPAALFAWLAEHGGPALPVEGPSRG